MKERAQQAPLDGQFILCADVAQRLQHGDGAFQLGAGSAAEQMVSLLTLPTLGVLLFVSRRFDSVFHSIFTPLERSTTALELAQARGERDPQTGDVPGSPEIKHGIVAHGKGADDRQQWCSELCK